MGRFVHFFVLDFFFFYSVKQKMFLVRYQLKDFTHKFSYLKAFSFFLLTIYSVIEYNFYRITFFFCNLSWTSIQFRVGFVKPIIQRICRQRTANPMTLTHPCVWTLLVKLGPFSFKIKAAPFKLLLWWGAFSISSLRCTFANYNHLGSS